MRNYSWKKCFLVIIISSIGGLSIGKLLNYLLETYSLENIEKMVLPILSSTFVVAFILGCIGLAGYIYFNYRLKKDQYTDMENSFYDQNVKMIGAVAVCSTLCAIVNFTALGLNLFNETSLSILFLINVVLAFFGEVAHISLIKKIRPELNADPLTSGFSKKHYDNLDEYEQYKTGKASYMTISVMTPIYVFLFLSCYILTVVFNVSPLICLPIGVIWIAQTILMTFYTNKAS